MSEYVFLSPHFDDSILSCYHLIDQVRFSEPSGNNPKVITLFAGTPPVPQRTDWDTRAGFRDSTHAMAVRRVENEMAFAGTAATLVNLDYLDGQYTHPPRDIRDMTETIVEHIPDDTIIIAASGISHYWRRVNPDHIVTRMIGQQLLRMGRYVVFHADIPYMLPYVYYDRWPERLSAEQISRTLGMDIAVDAIELSSEQQARKRAAVEAYGSQYALLCQDLWHTMRRTAAYRWEALFRPLRSSAPQS